MVVKMTEFGSLHDKKCLVVILLVSWKKGYGNCKTIGFVSRVKQLGVYVFKRNVAGK